MSKVVFVCKNTLNKAKKSASVFPDKLDMESVLDRITPDNISNVSTKYTYDKDGISFGLLNPTDEINVRESSICLGHLIDGREDWFLPSNSNLDGSYAVYRSDQKQVELLTDIVSSRTIWYVKTEGVFIASCSQRAIVMLLGSFQINNVALPWMLSSGMLGPNNSWDLRINQLQGNSRLILDRLTWEISVHTSLSAFRSNSLPRNQHRNRLKRACKSSVDKLNLDYTKGILTISGGYDSRALLLMLNSPKDLKCIHYGLKDGKKELGTDAAVTDELAKEMGLNYQFYATDISDEPIDIIFNRFLVAGEGRIDHISGYMDGFKIWKNIHEEKYQWILRADEGFGSNLVETERDVRMNLYLLAMLKDYPNIHEIYDDFDLPLQKIPDSLIREKKESIETWRDRIYHDYMFPQYLAALSELKTAFIEVINPFISKEIFDVIRSMPDKYRTNKSVFKEIVSELSPDVAFTKLKSVAAPKNILQEERVIEEIVSELDRPSAINYLSEILISYIKNQLQTKKNGSGSSKIISRVKSRVIKHVPKWVISKYVKLRPKVYPPINAHVFAFRAYIICKMTRILDEDAQFFANIKNSKMSNRS
jgi:asparagine synthetase B (glutamine-hydrolysing)